MLSGHQFLLVELVDLLERLCMPRLVSVRSEQWQRRVARGQGVRETFSAVVESAQVACEVFDLDVDEGVHGKLHEEDRVWDPEVLGDRPPGLLGVVEKGLYLAVCAPVLGGLRFELLAELINLSGHFLHDGVLEQRVGDRPVRCQGEDHEGVEQLIDGEDCRGVESVQGVDSGCGRGRFVRLVCRLLAGPFVVYLRYAAAVR